MSRRILVSYEIIFDRWDEVGTDGEDIKGGKVERLNDVENCTSILNFLESRMRAYVIGALAAITGASARTFTVYIACTVIVGFTDVKL